jgi:hypothetical protein
MYELKQETKNIPEKRFSAGTISATVWQNAGKAKDGQTISYRTVSLQRRYKDKNGAWQNANSLRLNDLPKASLVLQKAYEFMVLRDAASGSAEYPIEEDLIEEVI